MDIEQLMSEIDYDWKVYDLEHTDDDEKKVTNVFWRCDGTYGEARSVREGSCDDIATPINSKFIKYEELTEETIFSWLEGSNLFDRKVVETAIAKSIHQQIRPTIMNGVPWEK